MIRTILLVVLLCLVAFGTQAQPGYNQVYLPYFEELKLATATHKTLWNLDLYGPILLVDPGTRQVFANETDTAGVLKREGDLCYGTLPKRVNIANAAVEWGGRRWAMVMLPLPDDKAVRLQLLAHELFHRAQPELGFKGLGPISSHLDRLIGRVYLRLELEALKKAMNASGPDRNSHLASALVFRRFRHAQFPKADSLENLLELNEGLAEYTGLMMSGRRPEDIPGHLLKSMDAFVPTPTYVRSFAYQTVPAYGFLLSSSQKDWNRQIKNETDLTAFFQKAFRITLPADLQKAIRSRSKLYGVEKILKEENERDERIKKTLAEYRARFIERPHLDLPLERTNTSFDPRTLVAMEGYGTVYPSVRITDNWGILTATDGALLSADGKKATVSAPAEVTGSKATGNGWVLELNPGYRLEKEGQDFRLVK